MENLLLIASSKSSGQFVEPIIKILSVSLFLNPFICVINSVFILQETSYSLEFLAVRIESISSIYIIDGYINFAYWNNFLIKFSDSPTHLLDIDDDEIAKNVNFNSFAIALPIRVFPVPGGPNNKIEFYGYLIPLKISGFF